jgi:membrane protein YqaA with SNARE-associated domain
MECLGDLGYPGLFVASFLAATVLPFSSEVVLGFLLINGYDPVSCISIATAGNVLGSLLNYFIGFWGSVFFIRKILRVSEEAFLRAITRLRTWGVCSLFFAWVPVVGDPLTVAAGVLRIRIGLFLLLVTAGKLVRYVIVGWALIP